MIFMGVSRVKPEKCASAPGHASCRRAVSHRTSCARSAPRPPRVGELDEVALCGGAARDGVAEHIRTAAARSIEPRTRKHFLARACIEEARRTHLRSVLDERARPARRPHVLGSFAATVPALDPFVPARVPRGPPMRPRSRVQGEGGRPPAVPVVGSMYVATCTVIYAYPAAPTAVFPTPSCARPAVCTPRPAIVARAPRWHALACER